MEKLDDLFDQLKEVCVQLESGKLSLEDSINAYQRGVQLQIKINEQLNSAERRMVEIIEADGSIKPFAVSVPAKKAAK